MPAISSTAPGKVILFGEHAVVYGQPAIAVPVTAIEAKAIINPLITEASGKIHIDAPGIGMDKDLDDLPKDDPLATAVRNVLKELNVTDPPAFKLRITSTIPVASGLGSSAAVTIAIIRAVSEFLGKSLKDDRVCALAFELERLHHGTPSGIDNTVITYSRPVYFVKGKPPESFPINQSFPLIIVDTGKQSRTRDVVQDVRARWEKDKDRIEKIFKAIGDTAEMARDVIATGLGDARVVGGFMDHNHRLLQDLNVSSPELDRLVDVAREAGAFGAKLSGAGRGGNMIAVVEEKRRFEIEDALYAAGAVNIIATKVFGGAWGTLQ